MLSKLKRLFYKEKPAQPIENISQIEYLRRFGEDMRRRLDHYSERLADANIKDKVNEDTLRLMIEWHRQMMFSSSRIFDEVAVMHQNEINQRNATKIQALRIAPNG